MTTTLSDQPGGRRLETPFGALDEADKVTRFQWKVMAVAGMGFFTDAYDLFVIGVVVALLQTQWDLSTAQVSLLNSATLAASAVGALAFGRIADLLGRKRIYGFEVLILAIGALASALSPNFTFLLVSRIVLGIGIGGDYPVSATIMSEFSGRRSRGRMVGLVFSMQGAGLMVGPLLASLLLGAGVSNAASWRILLALGAVPGLAVFYMRRRINETPRYAAAGGDVRSARAAVARAVSDDLPLASPASEHPAERPVAPAPPVAPGSEIRTRSSAMEGFRTLVRNRRLRWWLVGTAGCWLLLDFAYYGNSISSPQILKLLNPHATLLHDTLVQLGIFALFALPGYLAAVLLLDRVGRKPIQVAGFAVMALCFLLIGLIPGITALALPFLLLYGISYLFTQCGPNTTTFVYPAEIFPVEVRTTGHGISAAAGKLGAFAGAYLFPVMLASSMGIRGAEIVAGLVCVAGVGASVLLLPEPRGKSLEELESEALGLQEAELLRPEFQAA